MVQQIINGMIAAIVGAVAFIAVKALTSGMNNSTWSSAERTMMEVILPLGIAIMVIAGLFMGLTRVRGV